MKNNSEVSLMPCKSYEPEAVSEALARALEPFGGMTRWTAPGQKVFLKVNLLLAAAPDQAITTHPAVAEAVIRAVQATGAEVFFGDLPGGFHVGNTHRIYKKTGMEEVAERTGANLVYLEQHGFRERRIENGKKLSCIHTPKLLDDMDVLINVPKLKTHMQALYTGAIKNMFGMTTSRDRMNAHNFSRFQSFSSVLVDIFSSMVPDLNVMDGIVGMEGTGPSQGRPVKLGMLLASPDAVAMDAVAAAATGFKAHEILTTRYAAKRGLGTADLEHITVHGRSPEQAYRRMRRPSAAVFNLLPVFGGVLQDLTTVRPRIDTKACRQCRQCVEVCPAGAIDTRADFRINDDVCVLCFCCHEMCEFGAVQLHKPLMVKVFEAMYPR